jgi:hypothetical protein
VVVVVVLAVVVFLGGCVVVALGAWRAFRRIRSLGRSVAAAGARIAELTDALEQAQPGGERRANTW